MTGARTTIGFALALAGVLAACASGGGAETASEPFAYADDPRLGPELSRVCWADRTETKAVLDDRTVVFFRGDDAFLVGTRTCRGLTDSNAMIGLTMEGACLKRGDALTVSEARGLQAAGTWGTGQTRCRIQSIHEWVPAATP